MSRSLMERLFNASGPAALRLVHPSQKVRREFEQKVAKVTKGWERTLSGLNLGASHEQVIDGAAF
jgi:hypothetical protein